MEVVLKKINERINELKYEKVHLKRFIKSDDAKINNIDFAIAELQWVAQLIKQELDK